MTPPGRFVFRVGVRVSLVVGLLLFVGVGRVDQAVRTAYATGWLAPDGQGKLEYLQSCVACERLPANWTYGYAGLSVAMGVAFLASVVFRRLQISSEGRLDWFLFGAGLLAGLLALTATGFRWAAAENHGEVWLKRAVWLTIAEFVLIGLMAVAIATAAHADGESLVARLRRSLQRQRINLLGVLALSLALIVVAQTSGQAIDSIRTWTIDNQDGWARLALGLASTLLLALVVYESAIRLEQLPPMKREEAKGVPFSVWLGSGAAFVVVGLLLAATAPVGSGLIVVGVLLLLLAVLELISLPRGTAAVVSGMEATTPPRAGAAEYLAIIPLLAVAATAIAAAVDGALSGSGTGDTLIVLLPAAGLAAVAVAMTASHAIELSNPSPTWWVALFAVVIVAAVVLVRWDSTGLVIAFGALTSLALVAYLLARFHGPWGKQPAHAYSLPIALAAGTAAFVATHTDVHSAATTLGTFAIVSIALAAALALLHFAVHLSLQRRAPQLLWSLGIEQLPIVTLLVVAWLASGLIRAPETIHEARLVDRQPLIATKESKLPPQPGRPTLTDTFNTWVAAQPELAATNKVAADAAGTGPPIPLVLVASQGGGIRAAYWTALALDCLIAVSASSADPQVLQSQDETAREQTCTTTRREPPAQQLAARRIFLASGVSGGAMGLYAYARELLERGHLPQGWMDRRLGKDFASPTIAWTLFHDVPNHIVGLNSHRAGRCAWRAFELCYTADRAAILEDAFDSAWAGDPPLLRRTWDQRHAADKTEQAAAELVPLLVTNATVTGGRARAIVTAADLGTWPLLETRDPNRGGKDLKPVAGTVDAIDALCVTKDIQLSTAAYLGGRFPFVGPSGHLSGGCWRSTGQPLHADAKADCADRTWNCETRLVDGGYTDNSGLLTIALIWPALRQLVIDHNQTAKRPIAPIIVELDNHYQATPEAPLPAAGLKAESLTPLTTAFGARTSIETLARNLAYRIRPPKCTITISPSLHPGLVAPLGWELSPPARNDLKHALIQPHPLANPDARHEPAYQLRRLQQWLATGNEPEAGYTPPLETCVPH